MSNKIFALPVRALKTATKSHTAQWTCTRCLATTTQPSTSQAPIEVTTPSASAISATPLTTSNQQPYDPSLPFSARGYTLTRTDRMVKRPLPHAIKPQMLMHVNPALLSSADRKKQEKSFKHAKIVGVVVRTGRMDKTVSVRVPGRRWEARVKKYFADHTNHLVHDPNNSLVQGDVVELHRLRVSSKVMHVVAGIVTPFGKPIDERPPIPTPEERLARYKALRLEKLRRRTLRRKAAMGDADAITELRALGLDPGHHAVPGKGETFGVEKGKGTKGTAAKGAILGKKGQKLPEGVLPGGLHEVGKIDARAKKNKQSALKMEEKAARNLAEAERKGEEIGKRGLESS